MAWNQALPESMPLLIHSCKSTQNAQKWGGQNGEYSVKGGFSAENPPFCRFTLCILGFAKEQEVLVDFQQKLGTEFVK